MPVQQPFVSRPLRAAALLFMGMAALLAGCAPFLPRVDAVSLIGVGLPYCLFLALFGVGLGLAYPGRAVQWWLLAGVAPLLGMIGFWLLLRSDSETIFMVLPGATPGLLVVLLAWLAVGLVVAGWGWIKYVRWHQSASRA